MRNSVCRSVLHVKSQLKVLGSRIIRAALRAALEKCYNASSPKTWFSPELEPAQVKTTSTLMILGSGPSVPFLSPRRVAARPPVRLARRVGVRGAALSAGSCVCVHAVRRAEVRAPSIGGRARGGRLMLLQLFGRRRVERLGGPRMSLPRLEARPAGGAEGLTEDASASRRSRAPRWPRERCPR